MKRQEQSVRRKELMGFYGITEEPGVVKPEDLEEKEEALCQVPMKRLWNPGSSLWMKS